MTALTSDQISRIHQAIADCEKQIAREMNYTEQHRDKKSIEFHIQHKMKLIAMLEGR